MSEVVENKKPKLIPDGTEVVVMLEKHSEKPTKKGDGIRASLEFKVKDQDFLNRSLFLDINVEHPSQSTVDIANRYLDKFLKATGKADNGLESIGNDRSKLMNFNTYAVIAVVGVEEFDGYTNSLGKQVPAGQRNKIRTFKAR